MKKNIFSISCLLLPLLVIAAALTACGGGTEPEAHVIQLAAETRQVGGGERVLPSLHISGINGRAINHRGEWLREIRFTLSDAGEYDFENIRGRIRGRGNSTWGMGGKNPYRIRFESPLRMFGTEYIARDWVLLANSMDFAMMRTVGAFGLGARMGRFDFSPVAARFVHLYLDGEYQGVYQLTDQMQRLPGRVEVRFDPDPALSEYYIEWCRHGRREGQVYFSVRGVPFGRPPGDPWFRSGGTVPFRVRYPNADDMTPGHLAFVSGFIYRVGEAVYSGVFEEVAAVIDIPTFVDFYLVQEFTKNADVFFSSVHFTVRLDDDGRHRLYAGPLWDFDQSAGGSVFPNYPDYSPQGLWAGYRNELFSQLMLIPEFRQTVADRWFEIRDTAVADTLEEIRYLTTVYRADFERNFERWPDKLGQGLWRTPPTMRPIDTFEGQVAYLIDWYEQRIVWLDEFFG